MSAKFLKLEFEKLCKSMLYVDVFDYDSIYDVYKTKCEDDETIKKFCSIYNHYIDELSKVYDLGIQYNNSVFNFNEPPDDEEEYLKNFQKKIKERKKILNFFKSLYYHYYIISEYYNFDERSYDDNKYEFNSKYNFLLQKITDEINNKKIFLEDILEEEIFEIENKDNMYYFSL